MVSGVKHDCRESVTYAMSALSMSTPTVLDCRFRKRFVAPVLLRTFLSKFIPKTLGEAVAAAKSSNVSPKADSPHIDFIAYAMPPDTDGEKIIG